MVIDLIYIGIIHRKRQGIPRKDFLSRYILKLPQMKMQYEIREIVKLYPSIPCIVYCIHQKVGKIDQPGKERKQFSHTPSIKEARRPRTVNS